MTKKEYRLKKKEWKQIYKQNKKSLKKQYQIGKKTLNTYEVIPNMPHRSIIEEIGNSVTHGLGAIFSVVSYILMLLASDTSKEYIGASIYFIGLFFMFIMSCLYHAFPYQSMVKRVFRRFDYSSIYLLIGATFAPILLCSIGGIKGLIFLIVQWVIIGIGITLIASFGPSKLKYIHFPLYFLLGWSGLFFLPQMFSNNFAFFMLILSGGITYSLGIIPFIIDKKVSHFIWNFFVIAGAVIQWIGIYIYIYLK